MAGNSDCSGYKRGQSSTHDILQANYYSSLELSTLSQLFSCLPTHFTSALDLHQVPVW